jgi:hypothetical protein
MSPGEALKQFCCEIPVLGLIGTQHMIPRDKPHSVDEDVQLVCKYLRALSIGGTKEIDKLYGEGEIIDCDPWITMVLCVNIFVIPVAAYSCNDAYYGKTS